MRQKELFRFFEVLSKQWKKAADILLLGGAASLLMGGGRPTLDIDFEVVLTAKRNWSDFEQAVQRTQQETGIAAQFSESVERWSQITLLDYRRHRKFVKTFGKLKVYLLESPYWSIGKISRYWDQDVMDMVAVFEKEQPDPYKLARLWQMAIQRSPRSTVLLSVKKHAHHFFKTFGRKIWGNNFEKERILSQFM